MATRRWFGQKGIEFHSDQIAFFCTDPSQFTINGSPIASAGLQQNLSQVIPAPANQSFTPGTPANFVLTNGTYGEFSVTSPNIGLGIGDYLLQIGLSSSNTNSITIAPLLSVQGNVFPSTRKLTAAADLPPSVPQTLEQFTWLIRSTAAQAMALNIDTSSIAAGPCILSMGITLRKLA